MSFEVASADRDSASSILSNFNLIVTLFNRFLSEDDECRILDLENVNFKTFIEPVIIIFVVSNFRNKHRIYILYYSLSTFLQASLRRKRGPAFRLPRFQANITLKSKELEHGCYRINIGNCERINYTVFLKLACTIKLRLHGSGNERLLYSATVITSRVLRCASVQPPTPTRPDALTNGFQENIMQGLT
jgi:hypothetical protein